MAESHFVHARQRSLLVGSRPAMVARRQVAGLPHEGTRPHRGLARRHPRAVAPAARRLRLPRLASRQQPTGHHDSSRRDSAPRADRPRGDLRARLDTGQRRGRRPASLTRREDGRVRPLA